MKIAIDRAKCGGIAACVREAPQLFRLMEGSKRGAVLSSEVPLHLMRRARAAAERCPYQAITIIEEERSEG